MDCLGISEGTHPHPPDKLGEHPLQKKNGNAENCEKKLGKYQSWKEGLIHGQRREICANYAGGKKL